MLYSAIKKQIIRGYASEDLESCGTISSMKYASYVIGKAEIHRYVDIREKHRSWKMNCKEISFHTLFSVLVYYLSEGFKAC